MERTNSNGWHPCSQSIPVEDVTFHVVDAGPRTGPVILLLHGFLMSSWSWRENVDELATRYRVIAPCLPGFGYSSKHAVDCSFDAQIRRLSRLLEYLDIQRCIVVGHSLGGALAMEWVGQSQERIQGLVLVASAGRPWNLPRLLHAFPRSIVRRLTGLVLLKPVIQRVLQQFGYGKTFRVDAEYMERFMEALAGEGNCEAALRTALELPRALKRLQNVIPGLAIPVRLIWGRRDRIVPVKAGLWMQRSLPNAELIVWDEVGHCPHEEMSGAFNGVVRTFAEERFGPESPA